MDMILKRGNEVFVTLYNAMFSELYNVFQFM